MKYPFLLIVLTLLIAAPAAAQEAVSPHALLDAALEAHGGRDATMNDLRRVLELGD